MKRKTRFLILFTSLILATFSIAMADNSSYLDVPATLTLPAEAGTTTINVSSNSSWRVRDNTGIPGWLSKAPKTGTGDGVVTVIFTANNSMNTRTGELQFLVDEKVVKVVNVTQGFNYLDVPATLALPGEAGTAIINVSSNVSWRVRDNTGIPGWLSKAPKTGTGDGIVTVKFTTNNSMNTRTGELQFLVNEKVIKVVNVTQGYNYLNVPTTLELPANAGTTTINVSSNVSWRVRDNTGIPGWLSKTPKTGTGNGVVNVKFTANTLASTRTGELQFLVNEKIVAIVNVTQTSSVFPKSNNSDDISNNEIPTNFTLSNYPNPFNPSTTIQYTLPVAGFTEIVVYNTLGEAIQTLVSEYKSEGIYNVNFNASGLPSGMYIYTLRVGNHLETSKLILMK